MEIDKLRRIYPGWDRCELMLQYSSRKTEPYWIDAAISFYRGSERRKVIQLGAGSKKESSALIQRLNELGYQKTGSRLNQEWQHFTFVLRKTEG